jgi:ADP-ribose pyrophosphatase
MVRENVTLDNGVSTDLDYIEHPGAAAIVPLIAPGEVLLIHQYRHALKQYIWEIPAGTLEPGEPAMDCARRELIEETGYAAGVWQRFGEITPVPGYSDERIHLFLASELTPPARSRCEILTVHRMLGAGLTDHTGDIQDG